MPTLQIGPYGEGTTIVDDDDVELVQRESWAMRSSGYVVHTKMLSRDRDTGKKTYLTRYLHRVIIDCPADMQVDHINRQRNDNRKANLRICSAMENSQNQVGCVIWFDGRTNLSKPWQAFVTAFGKRHYLGNYASQIEAAEAYNKKKQELCGVFAPLT